MNAIWKALCLMSLATIPLTFAAAATKVTRWEEEHVCRWWMAADDGTHRGSISPGNDGVVLSMSDPAFHGWLDSEGLPIELAFNGETRPRVKGEAWVTHVAGRASSMASVELDATGVAELGGATRVMMFRDGRQVFAMDLAGTPGADVLTACIPAPDRGHGDAES